MRDFKPIDTPGASRSLASPAVVSVPDAIASLPLVETLPLYHYLLYVKTDIALDNDDCK